MLLQIEIHNIALIDSVNIEMGEGLNILTGETGAGKSIIIDSINAILGERVSKDLIRSGTEKATIEAVFQISDDRLIDIYESLGIEPEEDGTLIISREFTTQGRNTCRINGKITTVSTVKRIGERIIDVHGQHDNQSLLRTENHIELLDSFGGGEIQKIKQKYQGVLSEYNRIKKKLSDLTGNKFDLERKIDTLKFQLDEITKAKLKPNEEEELGKQRLLFSNYEKIIRSFSGAYDLLFSGNNLKNSASDSIYEALSEIKNVAELDESYQEISKRLENITYELGDVIEDVRKVRDVVEFDPEVLEQIEERVDLIFKLKRKYGGSIDKILEYSDNISRELEELQRSEELAENLHKQLQQLEDKLYILAKQLNQERQNSSKILENNIGTELSDLEIKRAKFKVHIEFDDKTNENKVRRFSNNGLDRVEFLISPNLGEPLKPLSKIASGGELSRIMLAIKNILANADKIPTLIFDEIDNGISGSTSQKVGEKLSSISREHQVICVTHLAQIACMADNHYLIEKLSDKKSTKTMVKKLSGDDVIKEIARIIGGTDISDITLKHAEEMLKNAKNLKS